MDHWHLGITNLTRFGSLHAISFVLCCSLSLLYSWCPSSLQCICPVQGFTTRQAFVASTASRIPAARLKRLHLHQQNSILFGLDWWHLATLAGCLNSNKEKHKKSNGTFFQPFWILGHVCTRRFFLYKPGQLTCQLFFQVFCIFICCLHPFHEKKKCTKVTPNQGGTGNSARDPRSRGEGCPNP